MNITAEISMYPLDADYKPAIRAFVHTLRAQQGIETVTNQMSTQLTGPYDAVMNALSACIKDSMAENAKVVYVTKVLNAGLDIDRTPDLE